MYIAINGRKVTWLCGTTGDQHNTFYVMFIFMAMWGLCLWLCGTTGDQHGAFCCVMLCYVMLCFAMLCYVGQQVINAMLFRFHPNFT